MEAIVSWAYALIGGGFAVCEVFDPFIELNDSESDGGAVWGVCVGASGQTIPFWTFIFHMGALVGCGGGGCCCGCCGINLVCVAAAAASGGGGGGWNCGRLGAAVSIL